MPDATIRKDVGCFDFTILSFATSGTKLDLEYTFRFASGTAEGIKDSAVLEGATFLQVQTVRTSTFVDSVVGSRFDTDPVHH